MAAGCPLSQQAAPVNTGFACADSMAIASPGPWVPTLARLCAHAHTPTPDCLQLLFLFKSSNNTLCNSAPRFSLGWAKLFRELEQMLRAKIVFGDARQRSKLLNQSCRLSAQRLGASTTQVERKKSN